MENPFAECPPMNHDEFAAVLRGALFDCRKYDLQVGDVSVLSPSPLVIRESAWTEVSSLAEKLADEAIEAEAELAQSPGCWKIMGIPRRTRTALGAAAAVHARLGPRVFRFDFHATTDGWRISEANSDAPGGYNEASGVTGLVLAHYPALRSCGDPTAALTGAVLEAAGQDSGIAMVHATAYSDDRQVVDFMSERFVAAGIESCIVAPDHLRWDDGAARIETEWLSRPVGAVFRFFPAEWLENLPRKCGWPALFASSRTILVNPATAVLTQSKRFPLTWARLRCRLETWRKLLPETRDPEDVYGQDPDEWVLKPVFGRVGEDIGMAGVTAPKDMARIARSAARHPRNWVAQRRFRTLTTRLNGSDAYPCLGVYTVNGRVAGAFGRVSAGPITDSRAIEAAVLRTG